MRKINERVILAIAESLVQGPAGSLELKRMVDKRLNRILPRDTFYRHIKISKWLGIIDSRPGAKKVRGGYQTVHSLTERAKKHVALGFNLLDMTKYSYHKNNYEIVSVGDWSDNDDVYRLFLIMASVDTIESVHVEEMYASNENEMLERVRVLVPTISKKDLVIARKEKRMDGCVATYYKPVSCLQIWKEEYPPSNMNNVINDVSVTTHKITFYYVKILGASTSDIMRYNKDNTKRGRKFTGMITRPISSNKVQKALSILQRDQLITPIGKLKGETRYTIRDREVHRFIGNCLVIQDHIINLMNRLWQYRIRKIDSRDRRWLEMVYGHRRADRIISSNLAFLDDDLPRLINKRLSKQQELLSLVSRPDLLDISNGSGNGNVSRQEAIRAEIEESQGRVEEEAEILERYIRNQIEELQKTYTATFREYSFPIERIMQLVVLPYLKN